ncbi:hypothetical protein RI367_004914 [Sorochytrium milnesiophthora]
MAEVDTPPPPSVLDSLAPDTAALLLPYLADDFQPAQHASALIGNADADIDACIRQLSFTLDEAQRLLASHVSSSRDALLASTRTFSKLEPDVADVRQNIGDIEQAMARIRRKITEPYLQVQNATDELQQLQEATILARAVAKFQSLANKLEQLNGQDVTAAKQHVYQAATLFHELEDSLMDEFDITGISVVDDHLPTISDFRKRTLQAIQDMNQSKVANAIEILYTMGQLGSWVTNLTASVETTLKRLMSQALDVQSAQREASASSAKQRPNSAGSTSSEQQHTTVATMKIIAQRIDAMMKTWSDLFDKVHIIQRALVRTREPLSGSTYMDLYLVDHPTMPLQQFWLRLATVISEHMNPGKLLPVLRSFFGTAYPRIRRDMSSLLAHAAMMQSSQAVASAQGAEGNATDGAEATLLWKAMGPLEEFYLSRCQTRMMDAVGNIFPTLGRTLPVRNDVLGAVLGLSRELDVVKTDDKLCTSVADRAAIAVRLFAQKTESLFEADASAFVIDGVTFASAAATMTGGNAPTSDRVSVDVVNMCYLFYDRMLKAVDDFSDDSVGSVLDELDVLFRLFAGNVQPYMRNLQHTIQLTILKMHQEDFNRAATLRQAVYQSSDTHSSIYMSELVSKLRQASKDVFNRLQCGADASSWLRNLAKRVCNYFMRNVSIVRLLTDSAKSRMSNDIAQLERALNGLLSDQKLSLVDLGAPASALKQFRAALSLGWTELAQVQHTGDVPTIILLQHMFARQPASTPMPFQARQMSVTEYLRWQNEVGTEKVVDLYREACLQQGASEDVVQAAVTVLQERGEWAEDTEGEAGEDE